MCFYTNAICVWNKNSSFFPVVDLLFWFVVCFGLLLFMWQPKMFPRTRTDLGLLGCINLFFSLQQNEWECPGSYHLIILIRTRSKKMSKVTMHFTVTSHAMQCHRVCLLCCSRTWRLKMVSSEKSFYQLTHMPLLVNTIIKHGGKF